MCELNRVASAAMLAAGAHAATDITGYGLTGHLVDLCRASGVAARIYRSLCPLLPGAIAYVSAGYVPGLTFSNLATLESSVDLAPVLDATDAQILADPQTSGGLLVALPPEKVEAFRRAAKGRVLTGVIGHIEAGEPGRVVVEE
jgi:selenide,water dikinase